MIDRQKKPQNVLFITFFQFKSKSIGNIFQCEQKDILAAETLLKPSLKKWIVVEDLKNS